MNKMKWWSLRCIRKGYLLYLIICVLSVVLVGCEEFEEVEIRHTSPPSVPEEGGAKLTKITGIEDGVRGPRVSLENNRLVYRPQKFFDISKDGTKIAYMGWKGDKGNIFIKSLIGGKATLQRTFSENVYDGSFSPDGKWLAFSDYRDGSWNIYIVGAEAGMAIRQITTSKLSEWWPVFSTDGTKIFFVQTESQQVGGQTLYIDYLWSYDLNKGILMQYTKGACPTFTPDGKKVFLTRLNLETKLYDLWFVDLEKDQEFVVLSSKERGFFECAISPDGTRLVIVTQTTRENTPANLDLYMVNIDGTGFTQLTAHPGHDLCPRWAPDGKSLYFLSQRGSEKGEYNIWRLDF